MHTLEQLRSGALAGIRRLDLSAQLRTFPTEIFDLADSLEVLNLSHNQLTDLPADLPRLHKLKVLFASHNRFTTVPEVVGACTGLTQVGLRNNQISHLPAASLPPGLRWLTLTDNALRELPTALGACPALEKLMLAGNQLRSLPDALAQLPALALLRVAANQLDALPGWLWELPRLAWLAAAGNPWCAPQASASTDNTDAPNIPWPCLHLAEVLGEGASGVTHRARWVSAAGDVREVAVKLFKGHITSDGLPESERAACLAAGPHTSLTSALGRVSGHPQGLQGLVMPLLPAHLQVLAEPPSLASCSRDVYAPGLQLPWPQALRLLQDAASALAHLHAHRVLHGDFYAHNLLWAPESGHAVLSDFGAALHWPQAAQALWPRAQRLEVLAFGHLLDEVLAHLVPTEVPASAWQTLRQCQAACSATEPGQRPLMAEVVQALAAC